MTEHAGAGGSVATAEERRAYHACAVVLILAAVQYAWNALTVVPLHGYDAGGHAGYILTILDEGRLPRPYDGWSTFHPPLYYLLGAGVWRALDPIGPYAVLVGLRSLSVLPILAGGWVTFVIVRRSSRDLVVATVATALMLFVPVSQIAAVMIGNEALAAGFASLALPSILALQVDPGRLRAAALAGLFAGLALATKYTGIFVVAACAVPFARGDLDRRAARSLALCVLVGAVVASPTYVRNIALTGTPLPMTRELEPMKSVEAAYVLGPRQISDYLWIPADCLLHPSIVSSDSPRADLLNPAMQSVWGFLYASCWFDAFAQRIPPTVALHGVVTGPLLTLSGLVPTAVVLLGLAGAVIAGVRTRGRSRDAPVAVMMLTGIASVAAITWTAPAAVVAKCSYLLPLGVPAAVLFARGAGSLGRGLRRLVLACSLVVAIAAAIVFTNGAVLPRERPLRFIEAWTTLGRALPAAHIAEAARRLTPR